MDYLDKLYIDFERDYNVYNEDSEEFKKYLAEKKILLKMCRDFIIYMNLIKTKNVIELNKGLKDSVGVYLPTDYNVLELSKYASTFAVQDKIEPIYASFNNASVYKKNGECVCFDQKSTFITTITDNKQIIDFLINVCHEHNLLIGIYGNCHYKTKDAELKQLINLKNKINELKCAKTSIFGTSKDDKYVYILKSVSKI